MKRVLLTGAYNYSDKQLKELKGLGIETDFFKYEADELKDCDKYDAVICNSLFLNNDINKFKRLKYIQLTSAGYDRVPMDYIKDNNICIRNARGVYSIPIAEHTVMLALDILRGSRFFYDNQKKHVWDKNRKSAELYGKNAVIAGCGSIGTEIAKRLKAFGMRVTGLDITDVKSGYFDECRSISLLKEAVAEADLFISAIPYTADTYHIFGYDFFENMKKEAVFINISRGKVTDENALADALESGKIKGAALDVFEEEPVSGDSRLWDADSLIMTPHNSFIGDGNSDRMFSVIYNNLKEWLYE